MTSYFPLLSSHPLHPSSPRENFPPKNLATMPLTLKECSDSSTFSHIVDCEWAGYYNPYHPFMQVLFPVFGASPADRAAAIQESKERQWQWHSADPTSHWLYVSDDETREVVGGAQWHVHEKNPFENPQPRVEAYWWPEGESKRFVNEMLEQVYGPRRVKMTRPHTCGSSLARFSPLSFFSYHPVISHIF